VKESGYVVTAVKGWSWCPLTGLKKKKSGCLEEMGEEMAGLPKN